MNSHDLAIELLNYENLPVALAIMSHSYSSENHKMSHGSLELAVGDNNYGVKHIFVGHMLEHNNATSDAKLIFKD